MEQIYYHITLMIIHVIFLNMEFQLKMALSGDAKAINSMNTLQSIREESQGAVLKLLNGRLPPAIEKKLPASQTGAPSGSAIGRLLNGELKIDA